MFNFVSKLRNPAITAVGSVLIMAALPAGNAHAVNRVSCDHPDRVHIIFHMGIEDPGVRNYCFANTGTHPTDHWWIDDVSTGSNDVIFYDCNGTGTRFVKRHSTVSWRDRPPCVVAFEIL